MAKATERQKERERAKKAQKERERQKAQRDHAEEVAQADTDTRLRAFVSMKALEDPKGLVHSHTKDWDVLDRGVGGVGRKPN